jgi:hypothetical protein
VRWCTALAIKRAVLLPKRSTGQECAAFVRLWKLKPATDAAFKANKSTRQSKIPYAPRFSFVVLRFSSQKGQLTGVTVGVLLGNGDGTFQTEQ